MSLHPCASARPRADRGVTLTELMVAVGVLSIGIIGFIGAYSGISRATQNSKYRSLAANLAQEKVEYLKNLSYYAISPTTSAITTNTCVPYPGYDPGFFPPETLTVGGINYTRYTMVRKTMENSGVVSAIALADDDTGMKDITVTLTWTPSGSSCQNYQLHNLVMNPAMVALSAKFTGQISSGVVGGNPKLAGVTVQTNENTSFYGITDGGGNYTFNVTPGSYTLHVSSQGWFPADSSTLYVGQAQSSTQNFALTQMASGTVQGFAYTRDHLLISQVVVGTCNALSTMGGNETYEYIELYNPTTYTWMINDSTLHVKYVKPDNSIQDLSDAVNVEGWTYRMPQISSGGYYLFANTGTVNAGGVSLVADAVYNACAGNVHCNLNNYMSGGRCGQGGRVYSNGPGGIIITDGSGTTVLDKVGWTCFYFSPFCGVNGNAPSNAVDGNQIYLEFGMGIYDYFGYSYSSQIVRSSEPFNNILSLSGTHAWDTGNNVADFNQGPPYVWYSYPFVFPQSYQDTLGSPYTIFVPPHNSSHTYVGAYPYYSEPKGGTPAKGAVISSNDGLSAPAVAGTTGYFTLTNVATGTWTVMVASMSMSTQALNVTMGGGNNVPINSSWTAVLLTPTSVGYISGRVTDTSLNPLSGISVTGAAPGTTDSQGRFVVPAAAGIYTLYANPGNANINYTTQSTSGVVVNLGQVTSNINFTLDAGGLFMGFVTYDGTDAYPGPIISAFNGSGVQQGTGGLTPTNGYFTISNLPAGTYTVTPQGQNGEGFSPANVSKTVVTGSTVFVGTFTVSGSYGTVSGNVTNGGAAIQTGVLVVLSTTAIAGSNPPVINSALRSGSSIYYAGSSSSAGTYSLSLPAATYNIYAWYTSYAANGTPTTVKKTGSVIVTAAATATVNFAWP